MSLLKFLFGLRGKDAKNTVPEQRPQLESEKSLDNRSDRSSDPLLDTASANPANRGRDGLTIDSAIIVSEVKEEYAWMLKSYPGYMLTMQSIIEVNSTFYDLMEWHNESGETCKVYFDVTAHFAKLAERLKQ